MSDSRYRGEAGETLVELLITVSILGIAVVTLLVGLATAVRFSGTHRTYANTDVALGAAAESVKSAAPVDCPLSATAYNAALSSGNLGALPSPWKASNLKITARACSSGADTPLALQTITITATAPGGGSSDTIDVVKRSPS